MAWTKPGYGPNLGPLAIGLSAWEVGGQRPEIGEAQAEIDLYQLLESLVCNAPDGDRIAIADSKALYKPGGGLGQLERGVLSTLAACSNAVPRCFDTLVNALDADAEGYRKHLPWHQNGFDADVPADGVPDDLTSAVDRVNTARDQALTSLAARAACISKRVQRRLQQVRQQGTRPFALDPVASAKRH